VSASQEQLAIRRSTRLPLEIPVLMTSLDPAVVFSEPCQTTLVNAHGCGLTTRHLVRRGLRVRLEIVPAKRHTTAQVAEVVPLGGDPETWLLGLELDHPGNFWGIEYAPADWFIDATPSPDEIQEDQPPAPATHPAPPGRRWRLTDISAGACYLETASPFPMATPVLLSIRVADSEFLLDGMVRASHVQVGMGVEFTPRAPDHAARIEQLVRELANRQDIPRILVGRKEVLSEQARQEAARVEAPASEAPDPLLDLIQQGDSLTVEQFRNDLRAQRLGRRRDPRIDVALPVLLTGTDLNGRPLQQRVMTVNISRRGALLGGVHGKVEPGDKIFLMRAHRKEQFRVAWAGGDGTPGDGQIGVAAMQNDTTFWDDVLRTMEHPDEPPATEMPKAKS
jgi:hypothetical protein